MQTTDNLAYQIDTTELASTDGGQGYPTHVGYRDTQGCPCDDCPHRSACREKLMACELFRRWAWSKKHTHKGETAPRIPKKAIFQKLWGEA